MCEPTEQRQGIYDMPCTICVVDDCKNREGKQWGCAFGKPSNEMIKWAFGYTNALRYEGVKRPRG